MDKVLEHFGIYDFMGIWGPGAITVTYFYFTMHNSIAALMKIFDVEFYISESYKLLILFTVIAYVVGVVLHEFGRIIVEKLDTFNTTTVKSLAYNENTKLTGVFKRIKKESKIITEEVITDSKFYNNLNFEEAKSFLKYASKVGTKHIDKYHSIYALSRSLSVCFAVHSLLELVIALVQARLGNIIIILLDDSLTLLFVIRTYRYYTSWIRNTIIQYYYCKQEENVKNNIGYD